MNKLWTALAFLSLAALPGLQAQGRGGDEDAKKIIEKIQKEMEEINRLLNQASRSKSSSSSGSSSSDSSSGSSSSSSTPKGGSAREQLEKSLEKSDAVIEGIDTLLRISGQQGKGGSSQGKPKKPGEGRERGEGQMPKPENRQGQNPDFVNQGEQNGEKPQQDGDPKGGQKDPKTGKNVNEQDTRKHNTEKVDKKAESGSWGTLPPYLQKLFRTGGRPEVPARYREFEKEFHRSADKKKKR